MKPHLYILPFKDKQHIKIGISLNNNFNRIKQLSNIYDIDSDNIILYTSDNSNNIKLLEKNIKTIINETISPDNIHYGKDGHTEIRYTKHLNHINTIINTFKPLLNLYELNYTKQTIPIKKHNNIQHNIDNNIVIDNIINTLNNIKQYITYIQINNGILNIKLNLSHICNNDEDIDNILNPLSQSLYIYGILFKLNSGYTYDKQFKDVSLNLYNAFRIKNKILDNNNRNLQSKYNKFINTLL